MADYGLLAGLADGIKSGIQNYQDTKKYNDQQERQKKSEINQGLLQGYKIDPQTGLIGGRTDLYNQELSNKQTREDALKAKEHEYDIEKVQASKQLNPLDEALKRSEIAKNNAETNKKGQLSAGKSEGEKALDKDFAKEYVEYSGPGHATIDKNLARLEDAKKALKNDRSLTGGVRGLLPDFVRNVTNEKAITTRDDVRAAAQGALKATLGAQFTEKEGERIMNQAYNEKLSPEANIKKIQAAIDEISKSKAVRDAQSKYFEKKGTLAGWNSGDAGNFTSPQSAPMQMQSGGLINSAQAATPQPHPQDSAAVQWAKSNLNDPRAKAILDANGVR